MEETLLGKKKTLLNNSLDYELNFETREDLDWKKNNFIEQNQLRL